MPCEICGSPSSGYKAKIEGALLSVCKNCAGGGEIISRPAVFAEKKKLPHNQNSKNFDAHKNQRFLLRLPQELGTELVENFSAIIQKERQKKNLTRQELAKKISVQENLIARIENGWRPPMDLVKKLERFFGAQLTENV